MTAGRQDGRMINDKRHQLEGKEDDEADVEKDVVVYCVTI